jgi:DNA-binding NarL/FixJ family response regulator
VDVRVLLLEDSSAHASLVTLELERSGFSVHVIRGESEQAFRDALQTFAPDVVLAGHGLEPLDALRIVTATRPVAPVIIVAAAISIPLAVCLLRAGAENILLMDDLASLPAAISSALSVRKALRSLSPRQLEVLRLVSRGETSPEIAQTLDISVKTVETHRTELMRRIGVHDVVALVRYALRVGIGVNDV